MKVGILEGLRNSVRPKAESCVDMHGNQVEDLLEIITDITAGMGVVTRVDSSFADLSQYYSTLKSVPFF